MKAWWDKLQDFLEPSSSTDDEPDAHRSAAMLLFEAAYADGSISDAERHTVCAVLRRSFGLAEADAAELLEVASRMHDAQTSMYPQIQALNQELSRGEKLAILEGLWEVVFADGRLDPEEEHLLRKVSNLLHLPPREFVKTRELAREQFAV